MTAALLVCLVTVVLAWRARHASSPTPVATRVVSLALAPGLVRDEGPPQRVHMPAPPATLRLVLALPAANLSAPRCVAVISTAEGRRAFSAANLVPTAAGTIVVDVPAHRLPPGDYEIAVNGPDRRSIAEYRFGVLRP